MNSISLYLKEVFNEVIKDYILYMIISLIAITGIAICHCFGYSAALDLFLYLSVLKWLVPLSLMVFPFGYVLTLILVKEKSPLKRMLKAIISYKSFLPQLTSGVLLLSFLSIAMSTYSSMKALIPIFHPFQFDLLFHDIDYKLFFSYDPWYIVMGLWHSPYITEFLNFNYNIWFVLLWWILLYFVFSRKSLKRSQYLISWVLCWFIIGNILALILSSAGPAFAYKLDHSDQYYLPLMKLLNNDNAWLISHKALIPVWALDTQNDLWNSYSTGKDMLGSGISAMPSMHVSMAVLMTLGVSSINKRLGRFMLLFTLFIYIGSFSLAWHYAVDGLVSGSTTYVIWLSVGYFLNRMTKYRAIFGAKVTK